MSFKKPFQSDYAVEIWTTPSKTHGTGYRIGGRLVLTCTHIFEHDNECKVKSKSIRVKSAKVIWKAPDGIDISLLELSEEVESCYPVSFGKLPESDDIEKLEFDFLGWPSWGFVNSDNNKDKTTGLHIEGDIYLKDISAHDLLSLEAHRYPSELEIKKANSEGKSPWQGASGAAIIVNGLIVGVLKWHQNPDRPQSLEAESLAKVYNNEKWIEILNEHGINNKPRVVEYVTSHELNSPKPHERVELKSFPNREMIDVTTQIDQLRKEITKNQKPNHDFVQYAKDLIEKENYSAAINYLHHQKNKLWENLDKIGKYQLLAHMGWSYMGADEIKESAKLFIQALQLNPDSDVALANAARGYAIQGDIDKALELADQSLQKNPTNSLAYSLKINIADKNESLESVLELIPKAYQEDAEILTALGSAAIQRKQYDKAVKYLENAIQKVNNRGAQHLKLSLAIALMEPLSKKYPLIKMGQIKETERKNIEKSIALLTEIIGGEYFSPKSLLKLQKIAVFNKIQSLRLLGAAERADRLIENLISDEDNNDAELLKLRAIVYFEMTENKKALDYARRYDDLQKSSESNLFVVSFLTLNKELEEAEKILLNLDRNSSDLVEKIQVQQRLFDIYMAKDNFEVAGENIDSQCREFSEDPITIMQHFDYLTYFGNEQNQKEACEVVEMLKFKALNMESIAYSISVSELLYVRHFYKDAAEIYETFVDLNIESRLSRQLIESYYFSGNHKKALTSCETLLANYKGLPRISEIAVEIYSKILGDLKTAKKICEHYLEKYPNDFVMKLRLAYIYLHNNNYIKLDKFLDSDIEPSEFDKDIFSNLAQLYRIREKYEKLLDLVFIMRKKFYEDFYIHELYLIYFLSIPSQKTQTSCLKTIEPECGICLRDETGQIEWLCLTKDSETQFSQGFINPTHPLYQDLINHSVNHKISITNIPLGLPRESTIINITDKYYAAFQRSQALLLKSPKQHKLQIIRLPTDEDGNFYPESLNQFNEFFQSIEDDFEKLKKLYKRGKIPFSMFAKVFNRHPFELFSALSSGNKPFIHAWSDFQHESYSNARLNIQQGGLFIIDPISLYILHTLQIADDVIEHIGILGIPQSTVDLFSQYINQLSSMQQGYIVPVEYNGERAFYEVSSESVASHKTYIENIIPWIEKNCQILPCYKALDYPKDEIFQLNNVIGKVYADTLLLSEENGRILFSDDQFLRWFIHKKSNIRSVWIQPMLDYIFLSKTINKSRYEVSLIKLASYGYSHLVVSEDTLLEAINSSNGKISREFILTLQALISRNSNLKYIIDVLTEFLYKLYLSNDIIITNSFLDTKDTIVVKVLEITSQCFAMNEFYDDLLMNIDRRFCLIPFQKQQLMQIFVRWFNTQPVIT